MSYPANNNHDLPSGNFYYPPQPQQQHQQHHQPGPPPSDDFRPWIQNPQVDFIATPHPDPSFIPERVHPPFRHQQQAPGHFAQGYPTADAPPFAPSAFPPGAYGAPPPHPSYAQQTPAYLGAQPPYTSAAFAQKPSYSSPAPAPGYHSIPSGQSFSPVPGAATPPHPQVIVRATPAPTSPSVTISAGVYSPQVDATAPAASSAKIKLRIPRVPAISTDSAAEDNMSRRSNAHAAATEANYSHFSGRPTRAAGAQASMKMQQIHDDAPSDQDAEGEDEADEEVAIEAAEHGGYDGHDDDDGDDMYSHNLVPAKSKKEALQQLAASRRSGRDRKPPQRLAEGETEYQEEPQTSPVLSSGRRRSRPSRSDHYEDEQREEYQPPRIAFPTRATRGSARTAAADPGPGLSLFDEHSPPPPPPPPRQEERPRRSGSGRKTRSSQASKQARSDAEGSFEPSDDDGTGTDDLESDDPINGYEVEDDEDDERDEDDFIERSTPLRRTRNARAGGPSRRGPTRRSTRSAMTRQHDSEEESPMSKRPNLRAKKAVNYVLPPADISTELTSAMVNDAIAGVSKPNGRARNGAGSNRFLNKTFSFNLGGRDIAQAMGADSSDSDDMLPPIRAGAGAGQAGGSNGPKITAPTDVPNFGRINPKSTTADADPLGVDMNVTFDRVGGLDDHINQLKEMVALPLLYPELFQQFGITPPRGVLFHGPPGTGKTLLARALAASCSTGNTKISFFMRKGADVLSKWVGEAERQLRMLFEEARAAQPSIIFFDEIDGLAPVRSSKQDQIHASLVSTLLALMDGMDGRGQVIVIGATNRPDAVDPALRRPGRFDREFYFPLPNLDARKRIIEINTRKWDPSLEPAVVDQLGRLTKGYGGADLRALCTEAALNAIQRRYPQIYRSSDRYELDTKSIRVSTKDFMMSIRKIVPSSARSTSSAAMQLPPHLVPLLDEPLDEIKRTIERVMPRQKVPTALEEAQWEDEGDDVDKHMLLQALDKLRTHRPRVLVTGPRGMGQNHLGPAVLHHLEGFHVQTFDLGTLLGDSTRTVEASLIQLFVEARRHQPSIIYLPSLAVWSHTISDSARSTFAALLDSVPPSDPILVLGVAEDEDVKDDVWAWFGDDHNGVELSPPTKEGRTQYFAEFLQQLQLSPADLPDAVERRKRVLEELPLAAPLPPREPTEAEIQREYERDNNARQMIVLSFSAFIGEMAKKYKRVVAGIREDAMTLTSLLQREAELNAVPAILPVQADVIMLDEGALAPSAAEPIIAMTDPAGASAQVLPDSSLDPTPNGGDSTVPASLLAPDAQPASAIEKTPTVWQAHPIDLDVMQRKIARHKYFTPADVLHDISLIEENAVKVGDPDRLARVTELAATCRLHVSTFDPKWTPEFEAYKERMVARKEARQKQKQEEEEAARRAKEVEAADPLALGPNGTEEQDPASNLLTGDSAITSEGGNNKRSRDEDVDMDRDGKRPREDGPELGSNKAGAEPESIASAAQPAPSTIERDEQVVTVPAPSATIAPAYPPFNLPKQTLSELRHALSNDTDGLNVDQLEQLRAGLYSRLWTGRKEWDRASMAMGLLGFVETYVKRAGKARSAA